jgi:hypothetical protein
MLTGKKTSDIKVPPRPAAKPSAMSSFLAKTAVKNSSTKVGASGPSGKRVNRETLTPFDVTHYKGTGRAGQAPQLTYRAEPEEEAFSVHVRTARRDPASFTLGRTGLAGGVAGPAAAAEASSAMAAHKREVAPPLIKVRVRHSPAASVAAPPPPYLTHAATTLHTPSLPRDPSSPPSAALTPQTPSCAATTSAPTSPVASTAPS